MTNASNTQSKSAALYERAKKVMPGGCSRNAILRKPHPYYAAKGEGCYVTDIEGVKRIDFANNMASLIHGHANPIITKAVNEQMQKGTAFTFGTEQEINFAEHLCSRNVGFEKVRFVNSGTEAIMGALKAARAFTSRPKIAKAEGAYHGLYDFAEVSQTANPNNWGDVANPKSIPVSHGTPQSTLDDVVVIPYNDAERAIKILDKHKDDIACVLIDLMPHRVGLIPANADFIEALYKWTRANGALLVADEVITLRSEYGGLQEHYSCRPDLTAMGKMIGGGFPVGALAGRADVLEVMNPLSDTLLFPHSGTFSANPVTMIAGQTAMELFNKEAVKALNALGDYARSTISDVIKVADIAACVTGTGSMFRIHLKETPPTNYREAFATAEETAKLKILIDHLFDNGVMLISTGTGTLSTAMTKSEIDHLAEGLLSGFKKLA